MPLFIEPEAETRDAVVDIDLRRVDAALEHVEPGRYAIYAGGRRPTPARWLDLDDDGTVDTARILVPRGTRELVITSPGPTADGAPPTAEPTAGVTIHYEGAQR